MSEAPLIRPAERGDLPVVDSFIRELAAEEGLPAVTATVADLDAALFGPAPVASALIVQVGSEPAGFALYYPKYGTVTGRRGLHLEDLYIAPAFRNQRLGERVISHLAMLAGHASVIEWWVLHSNHAGIRFYRRLGAQELDDIAVYRLDGEALEELSEPGRDLVDGART